MNKLKSLPPRLKPLADVLPASGSWRVDKAGSTARGYDYQWQLARLDYLRAHPLCRRCKEQGIVRAATVVDHIRPHNGDMELFWDKSNWQALCATCHSRWKQRIERAASMTRKGIGRG